MNEEIIDEKYYFEKWDVINWKHWETKIFSLQYYRIIWTRKWKTNKEISDLKKIIENITEEKRNFQIMLGQ